MKIRIENLFGHEVENFHEVLVQMDIDIPLTKSSNSPPADAKDANTFATSFQAIGTGEVRPPERGEGNKEKKASGCGCIIS